MPDTVKLISAMEKVFVDVEPKCEITRATVAQNEKYSFQLAYKTDEQFMQIRNVEVLGELKNFISIGEVKSVPVTLAVYDENKKDGYYISEKAGVYPDVIKPIPEYGILSSPKKWVSVWCTLYCEQGLPLGDHDVEIAICGKEEKIIKKFSVTVLPVNIPVNDLKITNWIHYDSICESFDIEPFTNDFFNIVKEHYFSQVKHGMTMIYLPLFTPPLDTAEGLYRKTIQAVKITFNDGKYEFDFTNLKKLIDLAKECGFKYFEFSHLFSQWGAKHPPKIIAELDGIEKIIFGWTDISSSKKYLDFLDNFLKALNLFVETENILDVSWLHLSDEPKEKDFENYKLLSEFVKNRSKMKIMEAISNPHLCNEKKVDLPCVSLDSYHKFENVENKIIYTCCEEYDRFLTNRFICMPLNRLRILGAQLYLSKASGYLHWGYNFYHSELSYNILNPFETTDGDGGFPAGDAFIIYPNKKDKNLFSSIRYEAFFDAIQDYSLLKMLEEKIGRESTVEFLNEFNVYGFEKYPNNDFWFDEFREKLYKKLNY